jgi:putative DNA methylase
MTTYRKKLIEVALPLEAINKEAAREKSIRHGHPSTLHLWWARRPLAACRAVLFASLVDDPSSHPDRFPTEEAQEIERQRLFRIIEQLVKWENSNNATVLNAARAEILRSTDGHPPPVLDPFCGGGSIPLEAQRLGLEAFAGDLNPVAVLIAKALIEIPPKFTGRPPVNPEARKKLDHSKTWKGAQGLAEDVRYYGQWMRDEAEKRIGHLYPKVRLPKEYGGAEAVVIAWLWTRTIKCPNPACGAQMPLVRSFWLSTKAGRKAWVEPVIERKHRTIEFQVRTGNGSPPSPPKIGRGANFRCLVCGQTADEQAVRAEFRAKRNSEQLMASVAEGPHGRVYLDPTRDQAEIARSAKPAWLPEEEMNQDTSNLVSGRGYGITHWHEIFTCRQLATLGTFTDLVGHVYERVLEDARKAGMRDDGTSVHDGGSATDAYAGAVATYLGLNVSRLSNRSSNICFWDTSGGKI